VASLKVWWNQFQQMWQGWTLLQRLSIGGAALASVLVVGAVGYWSMQPQFVPVASDLTPATAAELVSVLEAAGISTQLNFSGSAVLVPKTDLSRARLASGKILDLTADPKEDLEGSVWADPTLHHTRLLRQQEARLARSISQFDFVRGATVHLSVPEPSPFTRDQVSPTASVVIELRAGNLMGRQDAAAIIALVAHSVEGLDPSKVTVMDTQGRILSVADAIEGSVAGHLEYRRRLEADLASKAETLLSQMLGTGKAVVRVTADVDFTEKQTEKRTFDPEGKVKTSETVKSESHTGSKKGGGGSEGGATGANPNSANPSGTGTPGASKIEENTTEYANAETKDTVREAPGKLIRLTVAAVVQLPEAADSQGVTITPEGVEALIKQAVGFDATRNDEIKVVPATLAGAAPIVADPVGVPWDKYERLIRAASLGLAAIVAIVMGFLVLKRFQPTVTAAPATSELDDEAERLAAFSIQARENPEAVAQALSAWMASTRPTGQQQTTVPFRKAG
jgi:flagellar M-ring protein FliF